ncbi:MAG: tetratricopeptide repeat protein [Candidatus Limnocylindrales bacterium]
MATVAQELQRDDPEAYIARDRRRALAEREVMPDRVRGAALFADISGFTPLTEALAQELGPQRGAEELTANLGRVFHAVIEELDRRGGDVIYFSGDAITCWLDGDDGARATSAALAMQDAMARVGSITTPGGTSVQLALKVAVAVGKARRFVVGDPDIQLIDVLAGALIDDLADAEHHAEKGDVVLDTSALDALAGRVRLSEHREDPERGRAFGVVERLLVEVPTVDVVEPPALDEALVRPWLLPAVYERLRAGRGEFLAELRPAYPVFLRFGGIDYDDDPDAIAKLDAFVVQAQRIMAGYGGNVLQLTLGDKGAYLYGVFGSPVAHEDDASRAASAALDLRDLERTTDAQDIQIGVTRGRLRSGTYGHAMRRTFVCLGDAVNLSARLMSAAPAGGIYVDDRIRQEAGDAYIWEQLPDLSVKGKKGAIVAHALNGSLERASRRKTRYQLELVGRRAELERLDAHLDATLAGDGRIVGISAEAGMGKSRLIAEFVRSARRRGLFVAFGECQSFGTNTSYFVWREIWRRLFGLEDGEPVERDRERLVTALTDIDPALVGRAPLLGAAVGIDFPDNELTGALDAKVRKASLEDLLATCLRARSDREPIVLVLEDCHWIDALSRDLLEVLGRVTADLPVLVVLAYRPASVPGGGLDVERIADFSELLLDEMGPDDAATLIRSKLEQVLGLGDEVEIGADLVELVTDRSQGNPFYIEELVSFIAAQGVDPGDAAALRAVQLPESLHSLVLSRIDTMDEAPRRTLKVASVVGRVFEAPILPGAYPELGDLDGVIANLDTLRTADLVSLDREQDRAYLFKHVATQEVAYESLPFAVRSMLHGRIGGYLEGAHADALDQHLDLLAHHFWLSDDTDRKRQYLERAAEAARASYANAAAIQYLERLLTLLDGAERAAALLKLAKVKELTGDWTTAETTAREALAISTDLDDQTGQGWAYAALAEIARKQGRYDDATGHLGAAQARFEATGVDAGAGQVLHLAGTVAAQRGDYESAQARYEESLVIRERLDDRASMAALFSNLGVIAEYRGDYASARNLNERALQIRTAIGDARGIGVSENNVGMIALLEGDSEEARRRFEAAIKLCADVGDVAMVAIARNNLANSLRASGDYARARTAYVDALRAYRDLADSWGLAFLFEDIAVLAGMTGAEPRMFELLGAAESIRKEIGAPRNPGLVADLVARTSAPRGVLGEDVAEARLAYGRTLDLDATVDLALLVCQDATGPIGA